MSQASLVHLRALFRRQTLYCSDFSYPGSRFLGGSRSSLAFAASIESARFFSFSSMARVKGGNSRKGGKPLNTRQHQANRTINEQSQPPRDSPPKVTTPPLQMDVPEDTPRFSELRGKNLLSSTILDTLTEDLNFDRMMPVQAATLEHLLQGKDCMAQAKTGTGKTLAFLLPAIETILRNKTRRLSALIICPTRELALQIAAEANKVLGRIPQCKVATAIGGTNKDREMKKISDGCDILVATPGRLMDHLSDEEVQYQMKSLQTLVLDEADRMVDMGFLPSIKKIMTYLPKGPRHTMLFSATIDNDVKDVAHLFLKNDYQFISTIPPGEAATHERVDQYLVSVPRFTDHAPALLSLIRSELAAAQSQDFKAIVFAVTAAHADFYGHILSASQKLAPVSVLHSRLTQTKRTRVTDDFRKATNGICVATDVIARGMDFPAVSHVFQVGIGDRESYIHRLGRTARAGAEGRGILVLSEQEKWFLRQLKGIRIQDYPTPLQYSIEDIKPALASFEKRDKTYSAWLGFHKTSTKPFGWTNEDLVREANTYALEGLNCPEVPALEKKTIGSMGLKGTRGLVISANKPGSNNPRARGGGEGRHRG